MGLLQKLKSALGLNGAEPSSSRSPGDVDVTVEREPSTDDEDAVKGTDTATSDATTTAETDSSVTETDDEQVVPEAEPEAEPETDVDSETSPEAGSEPEVDDEPPITEGSDDPVTEINGIGPAYGERLSGLGIETVGELAAADAAETAAETDLSEKRVSDWIEQAREY